MAPSGDRPSGVCAGRDRDRCRKNGRLAAHEIEMAQAADQIDARPRAAGPVWLGTDLGRISRPGRRSSLLAAASLAVPGRPQRPRVNHRATSRTPARSASIRVIPHTACGLPTMT